MKDSERIKKLGGPTSVARLLGINKQGGTQRVHNWVKRGIPAKVKLERPDLFLEPFSFSEQVCADGAPNPQTEPASEATNAG